MTDAAGNVISEMRYKAWGETRYVSGTEQTKYTYTGQYSYASDFGLHFYNARWYDSSLGRFAQADSIVPGGVQGLDRYAYVANNPLIYIDPSGHFPQNCGPDNIYCGGLAENNYYSRPAPVKSSGGKPPTIFEKAIKGDALALVELLKPTHGGGRVQIELAVPVFGVFGVSVSVGGNMAYNRHSNQLAANLDWAVEPGIGIGGGVSITGGPLVGWLSTNVKDATSGYSGIISGTAAAKVAGTLAITFPLEETAGVHVDPYYGQVPFTVFVGKGAGGGYAGLGGGVNRTFTYQGQPVRADFSYLLPWNWTMEKLWQR